MLKKSLIAAAAAAVLFTSNIGPVVAHCKHACKCAHHHHNCKKHHCKCHKCGHKGSKSSKSQNGNGDGNGNPKGKAAPTPMEAGNPTPVLDKTTGTQQPVNPAMQNPSAPSMDATKTQQ